MRAFVTGGTRGIGRAIVEGLLPRLDSLVVLSNDDGRAQELAEYVRAQFPSVEYQSITEDAGDLQSLDSTLRTWSASACGAAPIDVLVLNAGSFTDGALADIPLDAYLRNMNLNLNSYLVITQHLLPLVKAGSKKRIFITGSTAAYETYPLVPSYGIAKFGLRAFAINLRHELAPSRIGVTFLAPGGTLTDMWEGEELPDNRLLSPADTAILLTACLDLSEQAVVEEIIYRPIEGDIHE